VLSQIRVHESLASSCREAILEGFGCLLVPLSFCFASVDFLYPRIDNLDFVGSSHYEFANWSTVL